MPFLLSTYLLLGIENQGGSKRGDNGGQKEWKKASEIVITKVNLDLLSWVKRG